MTKDEVLETRRNASRAMRYAWVCFSLMKGAPPRRGMDLRASLSLPDGDVTVREAMINSFLQVQRVCEAHDANRS